MPLRLISGRNQPYKYIRIKTRLQGLLVYASAKMDYNNKIKITIQVFIKELGI